MKVALSLAAAVSALLCAPLARAGKTDHLFTVEVPPAASKAGEKGTAQLRIQVKPEGHISDEAPLKATLKGKNVALDKEKLGKSDAVYKDGSASMTIGFTAQAPGAGTIDADLTFYICSKEICERQERRVTIPVTVR